MAQNEARAKRALMAILGFACNQGFVYALFYLEPNQTMRFGSVAFERVDLFGILLFMCLTFYSVSSCSRKLRSVALSPRFALAYASLLVLGAGVPAFVGQQDLVSIAYESICVGIPSALMLCAWGKALGNESVSFSVPVICLSVALGAAICFFFAVVPVEGAFTVLYFAPLGSAFLLRAMVDMQEACDVAVASSASKSTESKDISAFASKVFAGTAMFGVATGLLEIVSSSAGDSSTRTFAVTLFLFVLFCIAALQVSGGRPLASVRAHLHSFSHASERKDAKAPSDGGEEVPLCGVYRLAMLIMTSGFLLTPVLVGFGVPGESIVLVGYLGITLVLMAFFLVHARVSSCDASLSFAQGFLALFGGELIGMFLGNILGASSFSGDISFLLIAIAGITALYAYLYLFTERDMKELAVVAQNADLFDAAAKKIAQEAGLSKREAELLPLALRGRTSERIAQEFYISKNTVDTHMRRIYAKCGVHSRQELIDLGEKTEQALRR